MSKVRCDFITNSSSSSFIIATNSKINKDTLMKVFNVNEKSPLYFLAEEFSEYMYNNSEEIDLENLIEDYGWTLKDKKDIIKNYRYYYTGYAANDGDSIEAALCEIDLMYQDENIIIIKEGGY